MNREKRNSKRPIYLKVIKVASIIALSMLGLLIVIIILVQTAPVQSFIKNKAVSFLKNKLHTEIRVGKIYIGLLKNIVLNDIYVEDRSGDTLFFAGKLLIDVDLYQLIRGNFEVNDFNIQNATIKFKRQLPDSVFNFQFIVDAFGNPKNDNKKKTDTTASKFSIGHIHLDNIRLIYADVVTGQQLSCSLKHLGLDAQKIDLQNQFFHVPKIAIAGLRVIVNSTPPLDVRTVQKVQAESSIAKRPVFLLDAAGLEDIQVDYVNASPFVKGIFHVGALNLQAIRLSLAEKHIELGDLGLSKTDVMLKLGKKNGSSTSLNSVPDSPAPDSETWVFQVKKMSLLDDDVLFDDDNSPPLKKGIDYNHLKIRKLNLAAESLLYSNDIVTASITKASLQEGRGLKLEALKASLAYSGHLALAKDLYIKTGSSEIMGSVELHYPTIEAFRKHPESVALDVDLVRTKVQVGDILEFAPFLANQPMFIHPASEWNLNAQVNGSLDNLHIVRLQFSGFGNLVVDIRGNVLNMMQKKKVAGDIKIQRLEASRTDLAAFLPARLIPQSLAVPPFFRLTGWLKGNLKNLFTQLTLQSSFGSIGITGQGGNLDDPQKATYDMRIVTDRLDVGAILKDKEQLGKLTLRLAAKGSGFDPKSAESTLDGNVASVTMNKYDYQNLKIKGSLRNQIASIVLELDDPHAQLSLDGKADIHTRYPGLQMKMTIGKLQLHPLHFTDRNLDYKGIVRLDFSNTNPDELQGKLFIENSSIAADSQSIALDTVKLVASHSDTGQYIGLFANFLQAELQGKYRLTDLSSIFTQIMAPYFSAGGSDKSNGQQNYRFTVTADIHNTPALKKLLPSLKRLEPVRLTGVFDSEKGWTTDLTSPLIIYGEDQVKNLQFHVTPSHKSLDVNLGLDRLTIGKSISMYATTLKSSIADNKIDFILNVHDKNTKSKYNVDGVIQQPGNWNYTLSFKPDNLILNYDHWSISQNNSLKYSGGVFSASDFELKRNDEDLSINSEGTDPDAPIDIQVNNFLLSTVSAFIESDTLFVNGVLNGKTVVRHTATPVNFVSNMTIGNLSIFKDTVGDIAIKVDNTGGNALSTDIRISGRGNNVALTGDYFTANSSFKLSLDVQRLDLASIVGASMGALTKASGVASGQFNLAGSTSKPDVRGSLKFSKAMLSPKSLNNDFFIDDQNIYLSTGEVKFSNFTIVDSAKNKMTLNGSIKTTDYKDFNLDLELNAKNFRALNSTKRDNQLYYGKLYFSCDLKVKGTQSNPSIDGTIKINEKTNLTVVVPEDEPGIQERQGIIEFVNKKFPDSVAMQNEGDTVSVANEVPRGTDISTNIILDSNAVFNLIIDQSNGDALTVQGRATLNGGLDPSGQTTLSGTYDLSGGSYNLSFSVLKRKFLIQSGSTIVWTGEPTKANLNINAVMIANTAPIDLVDDQLAESSSSVRNTYLQKLPFEVHLTIKGELLKPQISFDVVLPENQSYNVSSDVITTVQAKLDMLRLDSGEMNKQVFALLLLNRFVGDDPFASDDAGLNASSIVRSSVSQILSEQLNRLASSLIKGVDVNFNLQSTDDYTTGQLQNRTDLNVMVSKHLLNDRLTVTVGSDFELEGPQDVGSQQNSDLIGNLGVDYKLSKDGRYMLRAYRKNDYDDIVEGYVIETGMGFIITIDYNKFREIFSKKQKEKDTTNN